MIFYYIIQPAFILLGLFSAMEEEAFTDPFRKLTFENKQKLSDKFHRAGALAVGSMLTLAGASAFFLFTGVWLQIGIFFIYFVSAGLWYWNIFDVSYARQIGKDWDYVGTSADFDRLLSKWFGSHAGKKRTIYSAIILTALNLVYVLLLQ